MSRLLGLIVLLALLAGGFYFFRDRIPIVGGGGRASASVTVSEAAADQAEAKLERLRGGGETVRLSDVEFTSYLRYRFQDQLVGQIETPVVDFAGDTVRLSGRFPTDRLPDTREVRAVRYLLPDTADVQVQGKLRTLRPGRAALRVERASFARVTVPDNVYPDILRSAGRQDEPGLEADEYPFPLPPGVGTARVEGGELVLGPPSSGR
jgi:hypothetical protein